MNSVKDLKTLSGGLTRMLFAYDSDLVGDDIKKEFERYKKIDKNWNSNPVFYVLCIFGKGYVFTQYATRIKDNKKVLLWKYINSQDGYFEVACCISGMVNTITGKSFSPYLFDESNISILEEVEF